MAQAGFTPVQLYHSTTAAATPSAGNLANGELAINITDGKLYYKDNGGTVRVLAGTGGTGVVAGSNTQVQFNNNGVFGASSGLTWDGTYLTANSIKDSALTSGRVTYAGTSGLLQDSANLTFDGTNLTLGGGTANGVAYLNGSKVLTTGSALTFDGSSLTASGFLIANAGLYARSGGALTLWNSTNGNASSLSTPAGTGQMAFSTGAGEQMRLTDTGLGIGTSSPGARLEVNVPGTTGSSSAMRLSRGNGYGITEFKQYYTSGTDYGLTIGNTVSDYLTLNLASGNLGLGVTPSAWSGKAIEIAGPAFIGSSGYALTTAANGYFNGTSWIYKTATNATAYAQNTGAHVWYTAPSGTAGAAISFTQAMTLDASGNLGVGETNPGARLHVDSGSTGNYAIFKSTNANGGYAAFYSSSTVQGDIGTAAQIVAGGATTDFGVNARGSRNLIFGTNNTERARIDSSGNLLVGTTATGYANSDSFTLEKANGYEVINHSSSRATGALYVAFGYNGGGIGSITQNGTTGVLYNITSDYRLKNVVGAVTGFSERIDALKPIEYTWKSNGAATRGFLAHEFQEVYAGSVTGTKDAVDEDGNPVYQQMQASTTEVIADLVAELQSLRARVAQLEAK